MAPSSGHLLVPKALRIFKFAISQAGNFIRSKAPQASAGATDAVLQPIHIHSKPYSLHNHALLRQARASALRKFTSKAKLRVQRVDRPTFQQSKVGQAVSRTLGSPFASTLRPNLTGGALPRSAGGYGLGGAARGVRHFSHTGGAQAQVIQNVNAGVRAFCVGGGKARFDGFDQKTGVKRFKSVSEAEDSALRKIQKSKSAWIKGTNLEFRLNPTITALSAPLPTSTNVSSVGKTLGTTGFLDALSVDFARALKDLSAIHVDLKRLASFGDLPVQLRTSDHGGSTLSVRFAGCDGETVSRLCDEVGVRRGVIREDEAWNDDKDVEMALLFPFAPSKSVSDYDDGSAFFNKPFEVDTCIAPEQMEWGQMMSPPNPGDHYTEEESTSFGQIATPDFTETSPYLYDGHSPQSPSGYESLRESDYAADDPFYHQASPTRPRRQDPANIEGLESIYRFLAECDGARR
ncbi:MAG: hypothetical protein Q9220_001233 [cf. Caloplaca sp. 1 TL-2023]